MRWNLDLSPSITSNSGSDNLIHFCHLAALVITLYDHALTVDLEVEYIWKKCWSNSKALFILARYFGDLLLISVCVVFLNLDAGRMVNFSASQDFVNCSSESQNSCKLSCLLECKVKMNLRVYLLPRSCDIGLKFVGTGSMVVILITQVIMQLRIKAMYGKIMTKIITIFWIVEVMAVLGLGVASLVAINVTPYTVANTRVCNPTYLPRFAFFFWVPIIIFETFLFSLAFRMAYYNYLEIGSWRGISIFHVILRDNFIFFVFAFASYIVTAVIWLAANPRYFTVPGAFTCAFTTIMGCRLILNLCQVYHVRDDITTIRSQSIWAASDYIRFKTPVSNNMTVSVVTGQDSTDPNSSSSRMPTKVFAYELHDLASLDGRRGMESNDGVLGYSPTVGGTEIK